MIDSPKFRLFDQYYYETGCGKSYIRSEEWLEFFSKIAEKIMATIQPITVLDVGCAWGFLVEGLRNRKIAAFGFDISEYAIRQVIPSIKPYCWVGSLENPIPGNYDLLVCIEVLEHMPPERSEQAIAHMCQVSNDILFSSTPFDYKEATHLHVRPPEIWGEIFASQGFLRDLDYDASFITPWAVRYRRSKEPMPRVVKGYERRFFELWKENVDLRLLVLENRSQLSELHERAIQAEERVNFAGEERSRMQESRTWRLVQKMISLRLRLIPYGSWREKMARKLGLLN